MGMSGHVMAGVATFVTRVKLGIKAGGGLAWGTALGTQSFWGARAARAHVLIGSAGHHAAWTWQSHGQRRCN